MTGGVHYLTENPNADPVCSCGWDPSRDFSDPDALRYREDGRAAVRLHINQEEKNTMSNPTLESLAAAMRTAVKAETDAHAAMNAARDAYVLAEEAWMRRSAAAHAARNTLMNWVVQPEGPNNEG